MCGGAGGLGRKERAQVHMRQESGRLTSHLVPARSPGRQGGREEGHRLSDPLRWMGEGHRGTWEASSHGPRRGLRRGVGGGGGPTHPRTSWVLYVDPGTQATNKSVSLHGSGSPVDGAAGGKGSGHQGGRGWAPSHHPISFCNTSLAVAGPLTCPGASLGSMASSQEGA